MIGVGIGIGISIGGGGAGGAGFPSIQLSALTIAEDAELLDILGGLSTANTPVDWGDSAYTIIDDPDDVVDLDGTNVVIDGALDYETAQSHQFTVRDTPTGPYDPIDRTFTFQVTNVIEAPVNTVAPVVSGVEQVGETLSCTTGTWTDMDAGSFAYQWVNADVDVPIDGATSSTFLIPAELEGEEIYCTVTATNSADSAAEDSNIVGPFDPAPGSELNALTWGASNILEWGSGNTTHWGNV